MYIKYTVIVGMCLSVGVPPRADDNHRRYYITTFCVIVIHIVHSEFHNAFAMAAKRVVARAEFNHFDGAGKLASDMCVYVLLLAVMLIQVDDRGKFFDALSALSLH